jgi:thioredoxin reductase
MPFAFLLLFLGARPFTEWLADVIAPDKDGVILTGADAGGGYLPDTSVPGVFAAGDVRPGSSKRCAIAVGRRHDGGAAHARSARATVTRGTVRGLITPVRSWAPAVGMGQHCSSSCSITSSRRD